MDPLKNFPNYYTGLKEAYEKLISGKEILPVTSLLEAASVKRISLLTTDDKTHKLIGANRKIMEEALKSQNIAAKILAPRSNPMWNILLPTEAVAKSLVRNILITNQ